jgi:hypothetical protein
MNLADISEGGRRESKVKQKSRVLKIFIRWHKLIALPIIVLCFGLLFYAENLAGANCRSAPDIDYSENVRLGIGRYSHRREVWVTPESKGRCDHLRIIAMSVGAIAIVLGMIGHELRNRDRKSS